MSYSRVKIRELFAISFLLVASPDSRAGGCEFTHTKPARKSVMFVLCWFTLVMWTFPPLVVGDVFKESLKLCPKECLYELLKEFSEFSQRCFKRTCRNYIKNLQRNSFDYWWNRRKILWHGIEYFRSNVRSNLKHI